jgi:hypothetical protein
MQRDTPLRVINTLEMRGQVSNNKNDNFNDNNNNDNNRLRNIQFSDSPAVKEQDSSVLGYQA